MVETDVFKFRVMDVNSIGNFLVYSPRERCFSCREFVGVEGHPAFDFSFYDERAHQWVGTLFKQLKSAADIHPTLNRHFRAGGRISACVDHQENLQALQANMQKSRYLSAEAIQSAMKI